MPCCGERIVREEEVGDEGGERDRGVLLLGDVRDGGEGVAHDVVEEGERREKDEDEVATAVEVEMGVDGDERRGGRGGGGGGGVVGRGVGGGGGGGVGGGEEGVGGVIIREVGHGGRCGRELDRAEECLSRTELQRRRGVEDGG